MITEIRLENWLAYRGVHILSLRGTVYAIVAEWEKDRGRSNFGGKSSIPEAIRFALFGTHRHRTEDEWITRGEDAGGVQITLADGLVIRRERKRGKRTDLSLSTGAKQKDAQDAILKRLAMTETDYMATCAFEQRQMAKLVLADPSDRLRIVRAWTQIDKLEAACEVAREELRTEHTKLAEQLRDEAVLVERCRPVTEGPSDDDLQAEYDAHTETLRKLDADYRALSEADLAWRRRAQLEAVLQEGRQHAAKAKGGAELGRKLVEAETNEATALLSARDAADKLKAMADAATGFEGECPVMGAPCPARDLVTITCKESNDRRTELTTHSVKCRQFYTEAKNARETLVAQIREVNQAEARMQGCRDARDKLVKEGATLTVEPPAKQPHLLQSEIREVERLRAIVEATQRTRERHYAAQTKSETELTTLRGEMVVQRKIIQEAELAVQVLGRTGAQRRAAEVVLASINEGANALLSEAEIDLSVELVWAREGSGSAKACEMCGRAFPASEKVKVCACGAERGVNLIQKLEVELSDRSGGAEDLAGLALQFAASAWLRQVRGSSWDTVILDEPFGALDATHRQSLARHITRLLTGARGFQQAFVVAHSPDVSYSLPGRIQITVHEDGMRSIVVVD